MRGVKTESHIGRIKTALEYDLQNNTQILTNENLEAAKKIVKGAQIISPNNSKYRNGNNWRKF